MHQTWTRRSRWMNRIQLSDEGEDKDNFVAIAMTDRIKRFETTWMTLQQATPVLKSSEHGACQVKNQEKVGTTLLFDTGADAHVMPGYVGEQSGEPTLQPTRHMNRILEP